MFTNGLAFRFSMVGTAVGSLPGGQAAVAEIELANEAMALALNGAKTLSVKAV